MSLWLSFRVWPTGSPRPFRPEPKTFSFIGSLPALNEGISHITRLYLKKLKELKKLERYRQAVLAGSQVFVRAGQQVSGWENKRYMFASSADIPAS